MRHTFYFGIFIFFLGSCISEKSCSDKDRSCNIQALLLSNVSAPQGIYLYSTQTRYQGDLAVHGSTFEESLQNICYDNRLLASTINFGCSNILPLVSTSTHPIGNFPTDYSLPDNTNYPIRGSRGEIMATSWNNLLSVGLSISFIKANVVYEKFWTFTATGGAFDSVGSCNSGTDTASIGDTASLIDLTSNWVLAGGAPACTESKPILCLCY